MSFQLAVVCSLHSVCTRNLTGRQSNKAIELHYILLSQSQFFTKIKFVSKLRFVRKDTSLQIPSWSRVQTLLLPLLYSFSLLLLITISPLLLHI
uniref:Uncharacterized protein n=1 Tax=Octopus bimaculoides TaxID=37653 RepID=A0A0L8H9F0_OCTBM